MSWLDVWRSGAPSSVPAGVSGRAVSLISCNFHCDKRKSVAWSWSGPAESPRIDKADEIWHQSARITTSCLSLVEVERSPSRWAAEGIQLTGEPLTQYIPEFMSDRCDLVGRKSFFHKVKVRAVIIVILIELFSRGNHFGWVCIQVIISESILC